MDRYAKMGVKGSSSHCLKARKIGNGFSVHQRELVDCPHICPVANHTAIYDGNRELYLLIYGKLPTHLLNGKKK